MAQITSAMAAKQLRKLNDRRDALLAMEKKSRTFTAAIQEDVESVRPAYDYQAFNSSGCSAAYLTKHSTISSGYIPSSNDTAARVVLSFSGISISKTAYMG